MQVPVEFPAGMNRKTTLGSDGEIVKVDGFSGGTSQTVNVMSSYNNQLAHKQQKCTESCLDDYRCHG